MIRFFTHLITSYAFIPKNYVLLREISLTPFDLSVPSIF
jgi:hypothetical protein